MGRVGRDGRDGQIGPLLDSKRVEGGALSHRFDVASARRGTLSSESPSTLLLYVLAKMQPSPSHESRAQQRNYPYRAPVPPV